MSNNKKKYYVVWEGYKRGIFDNWENCNEAVRGFPAAKYKGFQTYQEAKEAFELSPENFIEKSVVKVNKPSFEPASLPIKNSICVDASCLGNPGDMEYRGVDYQTGKEIFRSKVYKQGTNNIGEFLALVHALSILKKEGRTEVIYSDSANAISWVKQKKCKTKLNQTEINRELFELIERAENWLQKNSWNNLVLKWDTTSWGEIPADFGRK